MSVTRRVLSRHAYALLICLTGCDNKITTHVFLEAAGGATFQVQNTFGQLYNDGGIEKAAHFVTLSVNPSTTPIRAPSTGEVVFVQDLAGLTNCLILTPKARSSGTISQPGDKEFPKPTALKVCLVNFDLTTLRPALEILFNATGEFPDVAAVRAAVDTFMDPNISRDQANKRMTVTAPPESDEGGGVWSLLGQASGGQLRVAAYTWEDQNDDGLEQENERTWVNPAPYFTGQIPSSVISMQQPKISQLKIESSTDGMFTAISSSFDFNVADPTVMPPTAFKDFIRFRLKLDSAGTPIVPLAISFTLWRVSRDDSGAIVGRETKRNASFLFATLKLAEASSRAQDVYHADSDSTTGTYWIHVPSNALASRNILQSGVPFVIDTSTLPGGEYEAWFEFGLEGWIDRPPMPTVTAFFHIQRLASLTEIKGLYRPDPNGIGRYSTGYKSEDGLGRIYSNHVFDPTNPSDLLWTKNRQYVELKLGVDPGAMPVPPGSQVVWEARDVDDPSNEDPLTHPTAGEFLDPNDFDTTDNDGDGIPDSSDGNDNTGGRDLVPEWEQVAPEYALTDGNKTAIHNGESKVRFNVTDDGGDNFIVQAKIRFGGGTPLTADETGVMAVWKRLDVEYVKMASADPLTGLLDGTANEKLAKAYVELVTSDGGGGAGPRNVPDSVVAGKNQMGVNEPAANQSCELYVKRAGGEFSHEGEGGWFFAAAANHFVDTPTAGPPPTLYAGPATVVDGLTLELPVGASLADTDRQAAGVKTASLPPVGANRAMQTDIIAALDEYKDGTLYYRDISGTWHDFPIASNTVGTVGSGARFIYDAPSDIPNGDIVVEKVVVSTVALDTADPTNTITFESDNHSWQAATRRLKVSPKKYSTPTADEVLTFDLGDHGFAPGEVVTILVVGIGALVVSGISPGPHGGLEGRVIVFTKAGGDLDTLIHEFGHGLGFHHICGNWDYRSNVNGASGKACSMNYDSWYLLLDQGVPRRLVPGSLNLGGPYFCREHIRAIRRQNLEDFARLAW
jgi:hypothetical protein